MIRLLAYLTGWGMFWIPFIWVFYLWPVVFVIACGMVCGWGLYMCLALSLIEYGKREDHVAAVEDEEGDE